MLKPITELPIVGLDVGEKYIHACELDVEGEIIDEGRFLCRREMVSKRYAGDVERAFVLEVGCHSRWIALELEAQGHQVLVVDPRRLKLISGSIYKDDKLDAMRLAQLGRMVPQLLSTVEIREDARQQALTLVRARAAAVKARTQIVNTIRGLLKPYGLRIAKKGYSPAFANEARKVVPAELMVAIEPLLATLEQLNVSIADYDRTVEARLPEIAPGAVHLLQINGVGPLTVLYFVALVGDPARFPKSRSIGSYFGLCRRRDDSGTQVSELNITKAGDPYMRALLTNCAAYIIGPFGKPCDLRQWGMKLAGTSSRRAKNRAKIAVARKLSVLMLTLWKTGTDYDPDYLNNRRGNETTEQAA